MDGRTDNKIDKLLNEFWHGEPMTVSQMRRRGIHSPYSMIHRLRDYGYAIYSNRFQHQGRSLVRYNMAPSITGSERSRFMRLVEERQYKLAHRHLVSPKRPVYIDNNLF